MKKHYLSVATVLAISSSLFFTSCIGSFGLTNKVLTWNQQVGSKFVNGLVFFSFWILPVYELSALADLLVINSIEFWSGNNPVAEGTRVIKGQDSNYLVKCDKTGYTITSERDGSEFKFAFNEEDNSWALEYGEDSYTFMTYVDDTHVNMVTPDGSYETVEISEAGLYAYQQIAQRGNLAFK